jgi:hypothetical protein
MACFRLRHRAQIADDISQTPEIVRRKATWPRQKSVRGETEGWVKLRRMG